MIRKFKNEGHVQIFNGSREYFISMVIGEYSVIYGDPKKREQILNLPNNWIMV